MMKMKDVLPLFFLKKKSEILLISFCMFMYCGTCRASDVEDVWEKVGCNEEFMPENCDFNEIPNLTVEDFERCGPAMLNISTRNYVLGVSGRGITDKDNKRAYRRIRIIPKMLRDVSNSSLDVTTLSQKVSFPVGLSPVAFQKLFHPEGEVATVRAISDMGTIMIVSTYASTTIEEVAMNAEGGTSHLWLHTEIFKNRTITESLIKRAEQVGYKAVVVTVNVQVPSVLSCGSREEESDQPLANFPGQTLMMSDDLSDNSVTFKDIAWVRRITKLPIVVKGILSASDATRAIKFGAAAILVSNHGGRQLDSAPATIDVLPSIVDAVNRMKPRRDVYVDGGIRNGWDVYKAIASGAKMAFIGRPQAYGLAKEGENGVREVVDILRREFEEAMLLSGASNPSKITRDTVKPAVSN